MGNAALLAPVVQRPFIAGHCGGDSKRAISGTATRWNVSGLRSICRMKLINPHPRKGGPIMPFPKGTPQPLPRPKRRYTHHARCLQWAIRHHPNGKAPCADVAAYRQLLARNITKFMKEYSKYGE